MGASAVSALVSCLMVTKDRPGFVEQSLAHFEAQQYPNRELIVVDDGDQPVEALCEGRPMVRYLRCKGPMPLGAKRNIGADAARGTFLVRWDDDDWHAPWRINNQVRALTESGAMICGLRKLILFEPVGRRAWLYRHSPTEGYQWISGGTFCYRRDFWRRNPYQETHAAGEDIAFLSKADPAHVLALEDESIYIAVMHPANLRTRIPRPPAWSTYPIARVRERLGFQTMERFRQNCLDCRPRRGADPAPSSSS